MLNITSEHISFYSLAFLATATLLSSLLNIEILLVIAIPTIFFITGLVSAVDMIILFSISIPFYGNWVLESGLSLYNFIVPIVIAFYAIAFLYERTKEDIFRIDRNLFWFLLMSLVIIFTSLLSAFTIRSTDLNIVIGSLLNLITLSILYLALKNTENISRKLLPLFILSISLSGLLTPVNPKFGSFLQSGMIIKLSGFTGNPNILAFFSGVALFLLIEYRPFNSITNISLAIVNCALVFLTFSRMGVGFLLVLSFYFLFQLLKGKSFFQAIAFVGVGLIIASLLISQFGVVKFYSQKTFWPSWLAGNQNGDDSVFMDKRLDRWTTITGYWLTNRPLVFLLGLGAGYHTQASRFVWGRPWSVHNSFLRAFLNSGIFVLLTYLLWLVGIFRGRPLALSVIIFATLFFLAGFIRWEYMITLFIIDTLPKKGEEWQNRCL